MFLSVLVGCRGVCCYFAFHYELQKKEINISITALRDDVSKIRAL